MDASPVAVVCRCPACGRDARLTSVASDSVCPNCGVGLDVSENVAARLTELQQRYAEQDLALHEAEVVRRQTERRSGRPSTIVALMLIAGLVLVTGVPLYLWSIKVIPKENDLGWFIMPGIGGLYVFLGFALWWLNRRPKGVVPSYSSIVLNGPPTVDTVARAESEADERERQVRLNTAAAERDSHERATRVARKGFLTPANITVLIVVFLVVTISGTAELMKFDGGVDDYLVLYGVPVAVFAGVLLLAWRRRVRSRRLATKLAPMRAWLGGPAHTSYTDTVAWLDEYWPVPTTAADLHATQGLISVAGVHRGFPVLVEVEPNARDDEYATYPARVLIYVAAPSIRADLGTIERGGFTVHPEAGAGLVARADDATIARLRKDISRLSELQPVISELTALAHLSQRAIEIE